MLAIYILNVLSCYFIFTSKGARTKLVFLATSTRSYHKRNCEVFSDLKICSVIWKCSLKFSKYILRECFCIYICFQKMWIPYSYDNKFYCIIKLLHVCRANSSQCLICAAFIFSSPGGLRFLKWVLLKYYQCNCFIKNNTHLQFFSSRSPAQRQ